MLAQIRDIAVVILALESVVIGVILVILLLQMIAFIKFMRSEVKPMIGDLQETTRVVKGTAEFLTEEVVAPTVKISSTVAGVTKAAKVMFKKGSSIRR